MEDIDVFIKKCKEENYLMPQYIPMCEPSHRLLITFLKKWISLLPVSHANPSRLLEDSRGKMTRDGYGIQYFKPLSKLDLPSYSWKMFQTSLMSGKHLMKFQNPFPKSASILNGQMYERPMLGPIIKEAVCSSLHTNQEPFQRLMLPTPTKSDGVRTSMNYASKNGGDGNLTLYGKVLQLPTPTANDGRNHTFPKSQLMRGSLVGKIMKENTLLQNGGKGCRLSPLFVEWMMGFPTGWTDLEV